MTISTRADDEQLLKALQMRCAGDPAIAIARETGMALKTIWMATRRVRLADLEESGEPRAAVLKHYPWD